MRQFILYISIVFSVLFLFYVYRDDNKETNEKSSIKVFATRSFVSDWGPGPELKKKFETKTGLKITYIEMSDPGITLQKVSISDNESLGDVVMGLDQLDIIRFADRVKWKDLSLLNLDLQMSSQLNLTELKKSTQFNNFIPYDWSAITFVKRNSKNDAFKIPLNSLKDVLKSEYKSKIAYEDPRTSSPGLQFLLWVVNSFSEDQAIQFLIDLNKHAHSFSQNWSTAYGLFKNRNADLVLSYITSPLYHLIEEHDSQYQALEFQDGLPAQIEFMGILSTCKNCEAANKFISYIQSKEAQKIIMEKNYMLPIDKQVLEGTAFDTLNVFKVLDFKITSKEEINKWLRIWADIRKNDG